MAQLTPVLTVTDLDRALKWYGDVLDFEAVFVSRHEDGDGAAFYAVLAGDAGALHLGRDAEMEQVAGNGGFEIATDTFDAIHERARQSGTPFYFEISFNPAGDENFAILDPDRNRIIVTRT